MSLDSWVDVPPGVPVHHHCHMSMEWSTDPKHWTDPTQRSPELVAWRPGDVLEWIYGHIAAYADEAEEAHGRKEWIEDALATYQPYDELAPLTKERLPTRWEHLAQTLKLGRWSMTVFGLSFRRVLVMWSLSYADADQSSGLHSKQYRVCREHQRPESKPYLGTETGHIETA